MFIPTKRGLIMSRICQQIETVFIYIEVMYFVFPLSEKQETKSLIVLPCECLCENNCCQWLLTA